MTKLQTLIFQTCFPAKSSLASFKHEMIPLRVLQVAAFCKDFPQTAYLEIWHSEIPKQDPILVGRKEQWNSENYLLARWGEALETFDVLTQKARPILMTKYKAKMLKIKVKAAEMEQGLGEEIETAILTGDEPSFSIYV